MGSFVGRSATATHCTTNSVVAFRQTAGQPVQKMTDFGGQPMKLKSLILGSVAAAGLSTAGFAADLGVLTSLDVCDDLGLTGLTISSDTNCLQISGEVNYEFNFGNNDGKNVVAASKLTGDTVGFSVPSAVAGSNNDWQSKLETILKAVATAKSDFGPAKATIVLRQREYNKAVNGAVAPGSTTGTGDNDAHDLRVQEAWVSVGDTTVLAAGKKGSVFNDGDDTPYNFLGLFNSENVDVGVSKKGPAIGNSHAIQLWSNIADGLIAKVGLEQLNKNDSTAGTLVGVLDYSGAGIKAHLSAATGGLLDGVQNNDDKYVVHSAVEGTFDQFSLRAALSAGGQYNDSTKGWWNGLVSGQAKFDMFKVALSAEAIGDNANTDFGFGGSIGATVAEGIELNLGGRYFNPGADGVADGYQVAVQLVAALTETIKLTTELGVLGHGEDVAPATVRAAASDFYGKGELAWTPGGANNFSSSIGATVQQNGAYKVTFKASKKFQ
jgi:hypothetical protein